MPELPEVETTIHYLKLAMLGQVIKSFSVSNRGESQLNSRASDFSAKLVGKELVSLERIGKWMLFEFRNVTLSLTKGDTSHNPSTQSNADVILRQAQHDDLCIDGEVGNITRVLGHLRMSGRYRIENKVIDHPHNRFQISLENGQVINYLDQRRFGTFHLTDDFQAHSSLKKLGVDALSPDLNAEYLAEKLSGLKKPIYSALLDQTIIAGLGNIYVNEILHAAELHPLTPAKEVNQKQINNILESMREILNIALEMKGTTLIDNLYQDPEGKTGEFAGLLKVYGKKNDPNVQVLKIGGRSVFTTKH